MLGRALDLLFPPRCAGCDGGASTRTTFCDACRANLVALSSPWCLRCGAPALEDVPSCRNCPPEPIARARAPFLFEGPARRAVHRLKFGGWRGVAEGLAREMARSSADLGACDLVTWVPLSKRRLASRGFDQAEALARVVARELDRPAVRLLERFSDPGGTQARRAGEDRRLAVRGRFGLVRPPSDHVLLVDDVLTTGATAAACASELVRGGASGVSLLVAGRAVRPGFRPGYTRSRPALGSVVARGEVLR